MNFTNLLNLSPIWKALLTPKDNEIKPPEPKRYSVTDLIGPPLIRSLKIDLWDKLTEDISERIWRVDGQILDEKLSAIAESFNLPSEPTKRYLVKYKMERRFNIRDKVFTVVGIPDLIDVDRRTITDWKKTNQLKVYHNDLDEWWKQIGIYAYLYNIQDSNIREDFCCYKIEYLHLSIFIKDFKAREPFLIKSPIVEVSIPFGPSHQEPVDKYIRERLVDHYENPYRECIAGEKWMTSDIFAIIKSGNLRALKICDSEKEAKTYLNLKKIKDEKHSSAYSIERRPGIPKKCLKYCPVRHYCKYSPVCSSSNKYPEKDKKPDWMSKSFVENSSPAIEALDIDFNYDLEGNLSTLSHTPLDYYVSPSPNPVRWPRFSAPRVRTQSGTESEGQALRINSQDPPYSYIRPPGGLNR